MYFLGVVVLLEGGLFAVLAPFVGSGEAVGRALAMLPPVLWSARLALAVRRGRITRRLVHFGGAANSASLSITSPDVYTRHGEPGRFRGYVAYETLLCVVVWALFGGPVVLLPILDVLGVAT